MPAEAINDLWLKYFDLRERHDPAASDAPLAQEEVAEIRAAVSKKNSIYLRSCGAQKLTAFLLTTADPPAISPTPKSESGDTSSES